MSRGSPASFGCQGCPECFDGNPDLLQAVPVPDGNLVVFQGLEVDGHTEGGADFILAAVAPADALGIIILRHKALA